MTEVWYILETGEVGSPRDIRRGADGALRHKDGRAVAMAPHGPRSRMVSADEAAAYVTREMKAGAVSVGEVRDDVGMKPKRPYRTRQMKAD